MVLSLATTRPPILMPLLEEVGPCPHEPFPPPPQHPPAPPHALDPAAPSPPSQEEVGPREPGKYKEWVKGRFKAFNAAVEAVYSQQAARAIPDARLKAAVRRVIKDVSEGGDTRRDE